MSFLKLLLSFAPWIAFLVIARGSLFRLELGLVVALGLSVVMGLARLQRGIILWASLAFFAYAALAVFLFHDMWTVRRLGVIANGVLAATAWLTVVIRKPFTLEYARAQTDPSLWDQPPFIRTNYILTSVWASVFTLNAALALGKMTGFLIEEWGYDIATYAFLIGAAIFTSWYPDHVRHARQAAMKPRAGPTAAPAP